jgi:hypothetical protein
LIAVFSRSVPIDCSSFEKCSNLLQLLQKVYQLIAVLKRLFQFSALLSKIVPVTYSHLEAFQISDVAAVCGQAGRSGVPAGEHELQVLLLHTYQRSLQDLLSQGAAANW